LQRFGKRLLIEACDVEARDAQAKEVGVPFEIGTERLLLSAAATGWLFGVTSGM
jgi:hypothetical protein